jgi:hypothetical protein
LKTTTSNVLSQTFHSEHLHEEVIVNYTGHYHSISVNMGYSKGASQPLQPPVYRDEPEESARAETASMASAVLLDDIDYPDEELPSYSDHPTESSINPGPSTPHEEGVAARSLYVLPPF